MKKVLSILLLLITFGVVAQEAPKKKVNKREKLSTFTPEQLAELQTKKMALVLDLDQKQQKELFKLNKEQATKRKAKMETHKARKEKGKKLSSEERFNEMNARLDEKLALQQKMKKILNEEQFGMWKKAKAKQHQKRKKHRKHKRAKHKE